MCRQTAEEEDEKTITLTKTWHWAFVYQMTHRVASEKIATRTFAHNSSWLDPIPPVQVTETYKMTGRFNISC